MRTVLTKGQLPFPKEEEVVDWLLDYAANFAEGDVDVRLQVYESGEWALRFGDPQYDQDHRGFWGSGVLAGDEDGEGYLGWEISQLAADLIDQAADDACMGGEWQEQEQF